MAKGRGRFSRFTYGTGAPKTTNVLGANPNSMDWNGPKDDDFLEDFTFGIGDKTPTKIIGSDNNSIDWNNQQENK